MTRKKRYVAGAGAVFGAILAGVSPQSEASLPGKGHGWEPEVRTFDESESVTPIVKLSVDSGPYLFWVGIGNFIERFEKSGSVLEVTLNDMLYAVKKSPRGFWDAALDGKIPKRFLYNANAMMNMGATATRTDAELFWSLVLNNDFFKKDLPDTVKIFGKPQHFFAYASYSNPQEATKFLERYYEMHKGKNYPHLSSVMEGIVFWKGDKFLGEEENYDNEDARMLALTLNNAHTLPKKERESVIRGLGAKALYSLTINAGLDLYTSSFRNYIAPALLKEIKDLGSLSKFFIIADPSYSGLGVFLEQAIRFGMLGDFFEHADESEIKKLFDNTAERLYLSDNPDNASVALLSIMDTVKRDKKLRPYSDALERKLSDLYAEANDDGAGLKLSPKKVLGVIGSAYSAIHNDNALRDGIKGYEIVSLEELDENKLFSESADGRKEHIQRWYFPPNADGAVSFFSALEKFRVGWEMSSDDGMIELSKTKGDYVVRVFINKPTAYGWQQGNESINHILSGKEVNAIVQRGHSYHVEEIIKMAGKQKYTPSIFYFGACGGTTYTKRVLGLSNTLGLPHVIATYGIGTTASNNDILFNLLATIGKKHSIRWEDDWGNISGGRSHFKSPKNSIVLLLLHALKMRNK